MDDKRSNLLERPYLTPPVGHFAFDGAPLSQQLEEVAAKLYFRREIPRRLITI